MAEDLELRDYLRTILRRKALIFVVTLMSAVASVIWAWQQRPKFLAIAQVKVTRHQTFADLRRVPLMNVGNNIQTYIQEMKGYRLLRRAASQLYTSTVDIDDAVKRYRDALVVEQEPDTDLINIKMVSLKNTEAVAVVKAVAKAFVDYHTETVTQGAQRMRRSIENWRDELLVHLGNDERRLEEFRQKHSLVDVEAEGANLVNRLSMLEDELADLEVRLRELEGRITYLQEQSQTLTDSSGQTSDMLDIGVTDYLEMVKGRLLELELERTAFMATGNYTERHPQVRHVETLLARVETARATELKSILNTNINTLRTEIFGIQARREKLIEKRDEVNRRLKELPELQQQILEIVRRKDIAEELAVFLSRRYEEARIAELDYPETAEITNYPTSATKLISNKVRVALAGVVLGFLLGVGLAFVAESLDTSIATIATFEETFNLPVLGVIPHIVSDLREAAASSAGDGSVGAMVKRFLRMPFQVFRNLLTFIYGRQQLLHSPHGIELAPLHTPKSPAAEAYRSLRTNLEFYTTQTGAKTIMVTSANSGEGKTVTAVNLALVMAQLGRRVLIIGGDMRKPRVYESFGVPKEKGLSDILLGEVAWQDTIKGMADIAVGKMATEDIFLAPGLDNLSIITCGAVAQQPSEWWSLPKAKALMAELSQAFDIVIVDCPPALPVPDAMIVGRMVDGCVLVYQVGRTARESMRRSLLNLRNAGANVLGFVLNGLRAEYASQSDFSAYTYYYYGGIEHEEEA